MRRHKGGETNEGHSELDSQLTPISLYLEYIHLI